MYHRCVADRSFAGAGNPRYPAAAWHARVTAQRAQARQGVARLAEAAINGDVALAAQAEANARLRATWLQATEAYQARQGVSTSAWQLALAAASRMHAEEALARSAAGVRQATAAVAQRRVEMLVAGQRLARANGAVDAATAHRDQWQQARLRAASRKAQDG